MAGVRSNADLAARVVTYTLGTALVLIGTVGLVLLLVATTDPLGRSAFDLYWPGRVVVLLLSLVGIGVIEGGLAMIRQPGAGVPVRAPPGQWVAAFSGVVIVVVVLGLIGVGLSRAAAQVQTGLVPAIETYVVGATFALYAVLRVVLTLSGARGDELAGAIGLEAAVPDPGETRERFALRTIFGLLVGIPLLDSLIVLVGVTLAPTDRRIYPTPSDATMVAALLWCVSIAAAASGGALYLRGRAGARRLLVHAIVAVTALLPAFVLDARVPLYPFIAGVLGQTPR